MNKYLIIFILLSLTFVYGYSQEEDFSESQEDTMESVLPALALPESTIVRDTSQWADLMQWRQWQDKSQEYRQRQMPEEALAAAESALVRTRALGLDLPITGIYWGNMARQALRTKDWGNAQKYSRLALLADNYSFKNTITQFQANSRSFGIASALGQFLQTIKRYRQDFRFRYRAFWLAAFVLSLAMIASGLFFLSLLTVKYLPYLFHLASDILPKGWPYFGRMFLMSSLGIGLLVVLSALSLPLAIIIPAIMVIAMGRSREKVIFWIALAMIGSSTVGFNVVYQFFKSAEQGRVAALAAANTSEWDESLVQTLAKLQQQDASDLKPIYALAMMEKNRGSLERAKTYLSAIIEASGNNSVALNNLGNLYFFKGQFDSAGSFYRQAIGADDHLAEAHYNLAQVYFKSIDFNQARAELEKASLLAPAKIEGRSRESGGNMVMDAQLDLAMLWPEVWRGWSPLGTFTPGEFISLTGLNLWLPVWLWLGLLVLGIIWMILIGSNLEVHNCWLCGRFTCGGCQILAQDGNQYCHECHHQVFSIQSTELQGKAAEVLMRRSTKRERIVVGLANMFLPGSAYVMGGSPVKGFFIALFLGVTYAVLVCLISPWISFGLDFSVRTSFYWFAGVIGGILYFISWMGYIRLLKEQGVSNAA